VPASPLAAQDPPTRGVAPLSFEQPPIEATIQKLIAEANHPLLRWPGFPDYREDLEAFYEPLGHGLAWFSGASPSPAAREAIDLLLGAADRGLDPEDYDASMLDEMWRALTQVPFSDENSAALFDVALTVGVFRHLSDIHLGRVDPRNLNIGFNIELKQIDLPELARTAAAGGGLREIIIDVQPDFLQYRLLTDALARYRELAEEATDEPLLATGTVREGDSYPDLGRLERLLAALGDLERRPVLSTGSVYRGSVVEAVKRFQTRHGLTPDGVIGPGTFEALNVPLAERAGQIELALERIRWLPRLDTTPFVVVNIPAFELWAFEERSRIPGQKFLESEPNVNMRVVVGKALNKQTPVFMEQMRWMEMRPYWNVPYSITVREILPAVRRDPGYLETNDFEIVPDFGNDIEALPVTPENIERLGSGQLHLRQRPGPNNSLGLVKFIFPNNANVYLHSTPATQLFARTRRDFSHGCVRVEDPVTLSEFVLGTQGNDWSRDRIIAAMEEGDRPTRVNLRSTIPVIIFYTTALVEPDGTVFFYDDIYGHDEVLRGALAAGYPYPS
jgi:murein L,D-transpeptidase YcbB/YkuD